MCRYLYQLTQNKTLLGKHYFKALLLMAFPLPLHHIPSSNSSCRQAEYFKVFYDQAGT